jgi:hypothetical protein
MPNQKIAFAAWPVVKPEAVRNTVAQLDSP